MDNLNRIRFKDEAKVEIDGQFVTEIRNLLNRVLADEIKDGVNVPVDDKGLPEFQKMIEQENQGKIFMTTNGYFAWHVFHRLGLVIEKAVEDGKTIVLNDDGTQVSLDMEGFGDDEE